MSFFKTMVVMGSGLALGCGGVSEREVAQESGSSGGGGTGGSPRGGAPGGGAPGGGAPGGGSAGIAGTGGTIGIAGAGGGLVEPGPFDCPPQQWVCTDVPVACAWSADGFELPDDCACDDTRPLGIADCAAGESFVCREGTSNTQGEPLTQVVPFECQCVPQQMYCGEACYTAFPYGGADCSQEPAPDAPNIILCDCAPIVLK